MFKKRNAQGLSITTIIIAVIGLIILVVMVAVFTGRIGTFGKGLDATNSCSAVCQGLGVNFENKDAGSCEVPNTFMAGIYKDATSGCCCKTT